EKHLIRKLFASRGVFVWKNGLCSLYAFGVVAFFGSSQKCIRCDKKILRGPAGFIGGGYPLRTLPALDLRTAACITVFVRAKVGILIHDVHQRALDEIRELEGTAEISVAFHALVYLAGDLDAQ